MVNEPTYSAGGDQDIFFGNAPSVFRRRERPRNTWRVVRRFPDKDGNDLAVVVEAIIADLSGGGRKYKDEFGSNRYLRADGIDASYPGYFIQSQAAATAATPDPTGSLAGVHSLNIFNTLVWGVGAGTDVSLIKETSTTDPTPAPITYNPSSAAHIISLSKVRIDTDNTASERGLIGLAGEVAQVLNDATGTIDGTACDATTTSLFGAIETSLPHESGGFYILIYANNAIRTGRTDAAESQVFATVTPDINDGGFALGELTLGGAPPRAFFVIPNNDTPNGMLVLGSEVLGQLTSFNLKGLDKQVHRFNEMPLGILQAVSCISPAYGAGVVATDGQLAVLHTGSEEVNLNLAGEMTGVLSHPLGGAVYRCRGFAVDGPDLYAYVETGSSSFSVQLMKLDWETLTWNIVSTHLTAAVAARMILAAGSHPVSAQTRFQHFYSDTAWVRSHLTRTTENPIFLNNSTWSTDSNHDLRTPYYTFPGFEGVPCVVESIAINNLMHREERIIVDDWTVQITSELTNSDSEIDVTFVHSDAHVVTGNRFRVLKRLADNKDFMYEIRLHIAMSTADSASTGQPLPIVLRLIFFPQGESSIKSPRELYGY